MTGAEIGPLLGAGKAVAAAGKKLVGESEEDKAQLARLADDTPEMQAAAVAYARRKHVVQQVRLKILQPLGWFAGLGSDYFQVRFPEDLAAKLQHIPEEDIVPPQPSVAGPALNGLSYSHSEDELKELYLNLLATASNKRTSSGAHPSFGNIIQQLSPEEAELLASVLRHDACAMVDLEIMVGDGGSAAIYPNLLDMHTITGAEASLEDVEYARFVDNWIRLGLFRADRLMSLSRPGAYDWAETHPALLQLRQQLQATGDTRTVQAAGRVLWRTQFGLTFANAVAPPAQLVGGVAAAGQTDTD